MPNPGDYKAMEVTGIPILITREKNNKVNAFRNVCTHRGAIVAQEGIGNKSRFSCPYHGWTYSNSGDLQSLNMSNHDKGKKSGFCCLYLLERR